MGPTWGPSGAARARVGPHVGFMDSALWVVKSSLTFGYVWFITSHIYDVLIKGPLFFYESNGIVVLFMHLFSLYRFAFHRVMGMTDSTKNFFFTQSNRSRLQYETISCIMDAFINTTTLLYHLEKSTCIYFYECVICSMKYAHIYVLLLYSLGLFHFRVSI